MSPNITLPMSPQHSQTQHSNKTHFETKRNEPQLPSHESGFTLVQSSNLHVPLTQLHASLQPPLTYLLPL
jgi:hypothetical protein